MIRKRLLSACLALALCLGLLPTAALAAGEDAPDTLYVGETQITGSGYWITDANGKLAAGDASNYDVYYDGNGTLTLKDATIQGRGNSSNTGPQDYGIYAAPTVNQSVSLTIKLIGSNTVSGYSGIYVGASDGDSTLVIQSDTNGSLEANGSGWNGITISSDSGNASLTINNASVVANSEKQSSHGVSIKSRSSTELSLTVNGGSLTAKGTYGIFYSSLSGTNPSTFLTVSDSALIKAIPSIYASVASIPAPKADSESGGIVFDGTEGTVYGDVTLDESLTIDSEETLTIPDDSSLISNGNLTNNGKIINNGTLTGEVNGSGTVTPKITTNSPLPEGTVGVSYTATLEATGNDITWGSNGMPEWMTLDSSTGVISGTPTTADTYTFTVTATNASGSASKQYTLTVNKPAPTTYAITADVTPSGAGTATSDKTTATAGDTVKLTATANSGYRFTGWTFSDNITGADSSSANTTFTMPAGNVTVTANFKQVYTVTVNASAGGTATADKTTAVAGEAVTLTATPDSGYHFTGWTSSDGVTFANASSESTTFTMPAGDVTVRAVFSPVVNIPDTHEIELIVGEGGEAKLSLTNASVGSTITVTATPDEGYELAYITVDGERISGTTFKMPDHDVTVRVYFTDGSATLPFTDVSAGAWYLDAVSYVYANGLMDGTSGTTFEPDANMTRAMVWAILARVDGETVTGTNWIETAREWAMAEGVSDGENASGYVTREQLATMLYRYAVYKGYDVSIGEDTNILSYADFADLSEYAIPAMQWACGAGVITGVTDTTLVPQGEATRAQVAAMLMRFVEAIG